MDDWHSQDWLIIIESLVYRAEFSDDDITPREVRAWELADIIAKNLGIELFEYPAQIDVEWEGR